MEAHTRSSRLARAATIMLLMTVLSGCKIADIKQQAQQINDAGTISGKVNAPTNIDDDVFLVVLRRDAANSLSLYRAITTAKDGSFSMPVIPGDYYVGAFIDVNGDRHYQADEPGQFHGEPTTVKVAPGDTETVAFKLDLSSRPNLVGVTVDRTPEVNISTGTVAKLADARFDPDNYSLGLWRPLEFLAGPGGGLFMFNEYDSQRIPVIFVHGMSDGPRRWKPAMDSMDKHKFQPWALYYPTGMRLNAVGSYMADAVHTLKQRYGFTQFAVVAHSMGGLVTRSFVKNLVTSYPDDVPAMRLVVTVNSPLAGMDSAASGVEHSPVVIPSWYDVATGSDFIKELGPWPKDTPYHLVFSYNGEESGDGTVALKSQLPPDLQAAAVRIHGFADDHVSTLTDPAFLKLMNSLLAEATVPPPQAASRK